MSSGYPNHILLEPRSVIKNSWISEKYCTMPGGSTARAGWINTEMFSGVITHQLPNTIFIHILLLGNLKL